jgi:hypothetical protein
LEQKWGSLFLQMPRRPARHKYDPKKKTKKHFVLQKEKNEGPIGKG